MENTGSKKARALKEAEKARRGYWDSNLETVYGEFKSSMEKKYELGHEMIFRVARLLKRENEGDPMRGGPGITEDRLAFNTFETPKVEKTLATCKPATPTVNTTPAKLKQDAS